MVLARAVTAVVTGDPGLGRLMAGWRGVVSLAAGVLVGYAAAGVVGQPVVIGVITGGLMGFITAIAVSDNSAEGITKRCAAAFVPFVVALPLSLALHPYRWAELSLMVVLLFVHMYANNFGPYGHDFGTVLFATFLSGLLLPLSMSAYGALVAMSGLSLVAVILARLLLCRMRPGRLLVYAETALLARLDGSIAEAARLGRVS